MRVLDDTICKVCQGVFCCAKCRHKHEKSTHSKVVRKYTTIPVDNTKSDSDEKLAFDKTCVYCPICEKRPLILKSELHNEILLHIELHHLPLRCQKCLKTYNKVNDLKEFSKCITQNRESLASYTSCYSDETSKITVTKSELPHSIKSYCSPLCREALNENHMTPISIINMRWKAKSKLTQEEFISDSVSSIKNISSINNSSIKRSTENSATVKGKVIRCSSTPVQLEMVFSKPKEQTFNATGGHMSSIQYNSGCESDISPAFSQPNGPVLETVHRYKKIAGASRPRMAAVTPLRQVMSKSIQKAFAEHGLPLANSVRNSSSLELNNVEQSPLYPALDLRLSPVIRRSQSEHEEYLKNTIFKNHQTKCKELPNLRSEIILSSQKLTTESIIITRTEHMSSVSTSSSNVSSNCSTSSLKPTMKSTNTPYQSAVSNSTGSSVFKSCSSVEIITTTKEIQQLQTFDGKDVRNTEIPQLTPITRIPGSFINKKFIKFETPKIELSKALESNNSPNDVFYTPNATPTHYNSGNESVETKRKIAVKQNLRGQFSPSRRPSIRDCIQKTTVSRIENINDIDTEDVFLPHELKLNDDKNENERQPANSLWRMMTSVMRLPSFKKNKSKESKSILKRCASIAGSLVRSKSSTDENELNSLKRKRTYTIDNTSSYLAELNDLEEASLTSDFNTSSKRVRIQGRRPIDRMRSNN